MLKTLEEVQSTMTQAEEAVLGNEFSRRARALEREDARMLKGEKDSTGAESMGAFALGWVLCFMLCTFQLTYLAITDHTSV